MTVVLDASMAISWVFDDERTEASDRVMLHVVETGAVVPSLWKLEIANMFRNAVRKKRCNEAFADNALDRLDRFPIQIDEQTDQHAWRATRTLSREQGLTPYDAAYLELAIRRRLALASRDGDLLEAARRMAVETMTA